MPVAKLREHFTTLHRKLLDLARNDEVCRRLMTVPGSDLLFSGFCGDDRHSGPVPELQSCGSRLGADASPHQSGESDRVGRISLCGDGMMRTLLFEAAQTMLTRITRWSWLKAWAMKVAQRRGGGKAVVALARRLAVILHRMWLDGTEFRWTREVQAA